MVQLKGIIALIDYISAYKRQIHNPNALNLLAIHSFLTLSKAFERQIGHNNEPNKNKAHDEHTDDCVGLQKMRNLSEEGLIFCDFLTAHCSLIGLKLRMPLINLVNEGACEDATDA